METKTIGVVVARFQTPELHEGHRYMLDEVLARHEELLVVLGTAPAWVPTTHDPLDIETRKKMVLRLYPKARIVHLPDMRTNAAWSKALDRAVAEACPGLTPVLYGSRDSFLASYSGCLACVELPPITANSGTTLRTESLVRPDCCREFRAGIIYAASKRPALVYQAVDVAIVDWHRKRVLLGSKAEDEGRLRFVGGFVDPTDPSLEAAAKREAFEEVSGLELADFHYLDSSIIDDWRYRGTTDRIMSALFVATYVYGSPTATDDLEGLAWVSFDDLEARLNDQHRPFGRRLLEHLAKTPA